MDSNRFKWIKVFGSYSRPYMWQIALSLGLAVVFAGANILFLPLARDIVNEISNKNLQHFNNQIFNAALLYGLRLGSTYYQSYLMTSVGYLMSIDIRVSFYDKLLQLSQDFFAKYKLGDILTRLTSDTEKVREAISMLFWELVPNVITFLGIVVYLLILNVKLTLFTLISVPLFVGIIMYLADRLKRVSGQVQQRSADIAHTIQETLSNIKLVQASTMEDREIKRFKKENMRSYTTTMKGIKVRNTVEPLVSYLQFVVILAVIWYGGYEIAKGSMSGPNLVSFFTGIFLLVDPVLTLSKVYNNLQQALASADRVFFVLDYPVAVTSPPKPVTRKIDGAVRFDAMSFSYDDESEALKEIELDVKPGDTVALVGLSGAGKTTFVNLLPRFYDATQGRILIDEVPIKEYSLKSLRSQIAIVPQEDILFRGTVLDNIRYGRPTATKDEVIEAAKAANAWEFIEKMPKQLYANIGDHGRRLSGGQKQRISIARAILKNPKILILDEATSALDSQSEALVQDALEKLMKHRTTFVIAHRLSTIMNAHRILVLENGRIVEQGTHKSLLEKSGVYRGLYDLQFRKITTHTAPSQSE
ncbi:MAG: ABC transporter ATP-binding protein [Candidatus Margulisiibacteriota bacterium]